MGEYAIYRGAEVKIGTCEDMWHLRWDQAHLVRPLSGSVDPIGQRHEVRFRFPWPDEDDLEPGKIGQLDFDRGLMLVRASAPEPGYHYLGCNRPTTGVLRQQGWRGGHLVPIVECPQCSSCWPVTDLDDMMVPLIALAREARSAAASGSWEQARWLLQIGGRILGGYRQSDAKVPAGVL